MIIVPLLVSLLCVIILLIPTADHRRLVRLGELSEHDEEALSAAPERPVRIDEEGGKHYGS